MDEIGALKETPDIEAMRDELFGISINDTITLETIKDVYREFKVMLEPHGAVGWAGLQRYLERFPAQQDTPAICLETAHPAKFPEEIKKVTGVEPPLPPSLEGIEQRPETYGEMPAEYGAFKAHLIKEYSG
jgi:threonine synthase